jgi:hypothetical protein
MRVFERLIIYEKIGKFVAQSGNTAESRNVMPVMQTAARSTEPLAPFAAPEHLASVALALS